MPIINARIVDIGIDAVLFQVGCALVIVLAAVRPAAAKARAFRPRRAPGRTVGAAPFAARRTGRISAIL